VIESLSTLDGIDSHAFASQRTSADQIEHAVREMLLAADSRFDKPAGVRASGDILWKDDVLCHINIKTTDIDKDFHMPNLISADNLWKIFNKNENFYLMRLFHSNGKITHKEFWDIRDIHWDNLQLGALGSGQLQLKNGLKPITTSITDHDAWVREWRDKMILFYEKEQIKIEKRLKKWQER
jgi:hypothetical protein